LRAGEPTLAESAFLHADGILVVLVCEPTSLVASAPVNLVDSTMLNLPQRSERKRRPSRQVAFSARRPAAAVEHKSSPVR
jgi:hypothetical protein